MEEYWTVSTGVAVRNGWSCRDCKASIMKGEPICVRDGRKLRFFYHERCFSGTADPRTQTHSSYQKWKSTISDHAPAWKGRGKWSVSSYGYEGTRLTNADSHPVKVVGASRQTSASSESGRKESGEADGVQPRSTSLVLAGRSPSEGARPPSKATGEKPQAFSGSP